MEQSKFYQIKNITEQEYTLVGCDGSVITRPIQDVDRLASAFTIKDAKNGDVLVCPKYAGDIIPNIFIFKNIERKDNDVFCHCSFLEKFRTEGYVANADPINTDFYPATKEQRDTLMKAMTDAGYTFDFEKKELKKIEQKPVGWSEEDEKTFSYLEDVVDFCYRNQFVVDVQTCERVRQLVFRLKSLCFQSGWGKDDITRINEIIETLNIVQANRVRTQRMHYNKATIDKNIDWLKSLKDRVQLQRLWKPSKEQMEALWNVYEGGEKQSALASLYNDLKKLIE